MNQLPDHRRVINGRTFSSSWSASHMDPIQRPEVNERMAALVRTARYAERLMLVLAVCTVLAMLKGLL